MAAAGDFPVTDEGWPLAPEGYDIVQEIGQGAFAKVMKARCPSKGQLVGIKIMALENITTSLEEIQAEVKTMKLSRHENVLDLYCCFVVKSDLWLIMPLMDKGSCYYILRMLKKQHKIREGQGLPEDIIAAILRESLQGLDYIHGHGQIHRDIKAGNILLNAEGRVAIADFGVAGWMSETGDRMTKGPCKVRSPAAGSEWRWYSTSPPPLLQTFVGTPCWMAPEVMEQTKGYNEKADVWSMGITALELFKGYAPYAKLPPMQVLIKTIREPAPTVKLYGDAAASAPSDRFNKFVARCLQKDPRDRPSAHELLSDPFIKRGTKPGKMAEGLLADIPGVGSAEAGHLDDAKPAGYGVVSLGTEDVPLVPGTTWVFPDDLREAAAGGGAGGGGEGIVSAAWLEGVLEAGIAGLGGETNTSI